MTVAELEGRMSGREFAEWRTLDGIKAKEQADAENSARLRAQTQALLHRG